MHLGVFSYNVDYGARPDELARAAEDRGFESFWVGEHTHIPGGRQTPYPGGIRCRSRTSAIERSFATSVRVPLCECRDPCRARRARRSIQVAAGGGRRSVVADCLVAR